MSDIKPCPFCGHIGLQFGEGSTFRWLAYSCAGCGVGSETRVQTLGDGTPEQWLDIAKQHAVAEWNRRATPAVPAEPAGWAQVSQYLTDYADSYVQEGDNGHYVPNEDERFLILDALMGLTADLEFIALFRAASAAAPEPALEQPDTPIAP